jgi:hypothetical protein
MRLAELKAGLAKHPELNLRLELCHGTLLPAHAHVTEVARIEKRFIDCGGTLRTEAFCRLQLWVAKDFWHRLKSATLLAILEKATQVLGPDDLEVDVEYELGVITQSPVQAMSVIDGELVLQTAQRRTDCLARKKSKIGVALGRLFGASR